MGREKDVIIQIEEIRHQLWLGHASLMVGCGFSLNADKSSPHIPLPTDWNKLGISLAKKLYASSSLCEKLASKLCGKARDFAFRCFEGD